MDQALFTAGLTQDGYAEIETKSCAANVHNAVHSHPFDVRAQMLAGELTLTWEDKQHTFRAGEIFSMPAGCEHVEQFGPDGATYVVGRRRTA